MVFCRCYDCQYYSSRGITTGYCKDLKVGVAAVDFCYEGKSKEKNKE